MFKDWTLLIVLNCFGIIKQLKEAKTPIPSIAINALLPLRLAELCGEIGARPVHFSADCVFSGRHGRYAEADISDADDLYGRSKFLGEMPSLPHSPCAVRSLVGSLGLRSV